MKTKYPSPWKVTVTFFFTSQNKRYTARYKYQLPFWQLLAVQMGIVLNSQRISKQSNYLNRKLINKKNELFSPHRISWSRNHWTAAVGAKKKKKDFISGLRSASMGKERKHLWNLSETITYLHLSKCMEPIELWKPNSYSIFQQHKRSITLERFRI